MFCKNCGAKIPSDSHFCPLCGKKQGFENSMAANQPLQSDAVKEIDVKINGRNNESRVTKKSEIPNVIDIKFIIVGFAFLLFYTMLYFTPNPPYVDEETKKKEDLIIYIVGIIYLLIRILIIFWVVKDSGKQKRNSLIWGLLSGCFPSISLIIYGFTSKEKVN